MVTERNIQFEFGCSLILVKFLKPFIMCKRGDNTSDRTPFGDTQSGFCKTGDTTHDNDAKDEGGGKQEPTAYYWGWKDWCLVGVGVKIGVFY